jgi:hypothetical protein
MNGNLNYYYDDDEYGEMMLDAAETVLGSFRFEQTV